MIQVLFLSTTYEDNVIAMPEELKLQLMKRNRF